MHGMRLSVNVSITWRVNGKQGERFVSAVNLLNILLLIDVTMEMSTLI